MCTTPASRLHKATPSLAIPRQRTLALRKATFERTLPICAGRLDAAEHELTRAFELNPRESTPLIHLGEMYLDKNNFERAAEVLSRAIRVEPGSAIAHYALGRARYKPAQYAEAEQAFTRAALLDKDFEATELMLLHVYVRQGKLSVYGIKLIVVTPNRSQKYPLHWIYSHTLPLYKTRA